MKRQKTVFSNRELAHVFAHETQEHGRNAKRSMYFNGRRIYSYGSHYLMAQIHEIKGTKFVIINSFGYSPSTGCQRNHVWNAFHGLMPIFYGSDPGDSKQTARELKANIVDRIKSELRCIKVTHYHEIKYTLDSINRMYKELNQLRSILGMSQLKLSNKDKTAIVAHYKHRLKRYHELNTPEAIAKREAQRERREELKRIKESETLKEKLERFRKGQNVNLPHGKDYLRIKGDQVETSQGLSVPLNQAKEALKTIIAKRNDARGLKIGPYEFTFISNEDIVCIGCHRIELDEAISVLGGE